jgi:hypothetical protein
MNQVWFIKTQNTDPGSKVPVDYVATIVLGIWLFVFFLAD